MGGQVGGSPHGHRLGGPPLVQAAPEISARKNTVGCTGAAAVHVTRDRCCPAPCPDNS